MAEDKIAAPAGSTGLMRFYDVSSSNIQLDPRLVIGFALFVIAVELILHIV